MTVSMADEAQTRGFIRAEMVANLIKAAEWVATDLGAELPAGISFQLPVPEDLDRAGRIAWVNETAASWKVKPFDRDGAHIAEKQFGVSGLGSVKFTASAVLQDLTVSQWLEAHGARKDTAAGEAA